MLLVVSRILPHFSNGQTGNGQPGELLTAYTATGNPQSDGLPPEAREFLTLNYDGNCSQLYYSGCSAQTLADAERPSRRTERNEKETRLLRLRPLERTNGRKNAEAGDFSNAS